MKIEKLSKEQEEKLAQYRDKWIRIGLDCSPCDKEKAEIFNKCFGSVFTPDDGVDIVPPTIFEGEDEEVLSNIIITPETVTSKLLDLKQSSAPGPDGIHPRVLKECATEIGIPL